MAVYVFFLVSSCSFLLLVRNCELAQQRLVSYVVVVLATFLSGLRGTVGTDTYSYHQMYLGALEQDRSDLYGRIEPLFAMIIDVMSSAGFSPYAFTFVVSILQGWLLCKLITVLRRPSEFLAIYLAMFYLNFHFNILRAAVATLSLLLALHFFRAAKSVVRGYLYCLIALGFHYSVIFFVVPAAFLFSRGRLIKVAVVFFIIILFSCGFLLIGYSADLAGKVTVYSSVFSSYSGRNGGGYTLYMMLILYSFLFLTIFSSCKKIVVVSLFLVWLVLRVLTHFYDIFGRLEIFASIIFVYYVYQVDLIGWRKQLRSSTCVWLVILWLAANFYSLYNEGATLVDSFGVSVMNYSPFTPYYIFFSD